MGIQKTTLGIEIGDTSLKLALFDHKQGRALRLGVVDVPAHPLREIKLLENTISEWAKGHPDITSENITIALPARLCVVRHFALPSELKDVQEFVEWEFASSINSPRSEYYMDYQVAQVGRKSRVAIVGAVRRTWLDSMRQGFTKRELVPGVVEVDAFSLLNLLEQGIAAPKSGIVCVVKVDRSGVIIAWGTDGVLNGLRWVSVGALSTMNRVEAFAALAKDLTDELHKGFVQVGIDAAAGSIVYLCGDLSVEQDFVEALRKSSPDFLYHLLDSYNRIHMDAEGTSSAMAPLCAAALGASLRFREDRP